MRPARRNANSGGAATGLAPHWRLARRRRCAGLSRSGGVRGRRGYPGSSRGGLRGGPAGVLRLSYTPRACHSRAITLLLAPVRCTRARHSDKRRAHRAKAAVFLSAAVIVAVAVTRSGSESETHVAGVNFA